MSALFYFNTTPIISSDLAFLHIKDKISFDVEEVWVTCLNSSKRVIQSKCIFKGSVNQCLIHPREIFSFIIQNLSSSFILFHSHPSNEAKPSKADIKITRDFYKASKILKIDFIDHIIMTQENYYSFFDSKLLKS